MTVKTKRIPLPMESESDERCGFRIGPNGEIEWLTRAETTALVRRTLYEAMVNAGFRMKRTLH
jgi:hypothetical protein